jgi:hypothetical protein
MSRRSRRSLRRDGVFFSQPATAEGDLCPPAISFIEWHGGWPQLRTLNRGDKSTILIHSGLSDECITMETSDECITMETCDEYLDVEQSPKA